ncbi:MAG TPA: class I SAM-dependent methyltransferase [Terriglobales bacterium]|nr:class I SAM-dependent methyltransferase [Terriglobales bacterium]
MRAIETLSQPQAVSMADEWFQFATADHFWMQWRHRLLVRALQGTKDEVRSVLEIGCGHGVARDMLERDLGIPVDGCDLNRTALELAKPGKGNLFVYNIFDQKPSLLGRYDAVLLLDVIEHIDDDTAFVRAALRHLRPGGMVAVNVPASMMLFSDYDRVVGHVRRYTRHGLRDLLESCGAEIQGIQSWGLLMTPLLLVRKALLRIAKRTDTVRTGFVPPNALSRLLLDGLKNAETALPFRMPFGTSILAWGRLRIPLVP